MKEEIIELETSYHDILKISRGDRRIFSGLDCFLSKDGKMPSGIVTSGLSALDQVLQGLRLGDNVVWQVDGLDDYRYFADTFAHQAIRAGRRGFFLRFAPHSPIPPPLEGLATIKVNPHTVFHAFSGALHAIIEREGREE